jgi:hypothetical protein
MQYHNTQNKGNQGSTQLPNTMNAVVAVVVFAVILDNIFQTNGMLGFPP